MKKLFLMCVLLGSSAKAHQCIAIDEYLSETKTVSVKCEESQALLLRQSWFYYAHLPNSPYLVRYWEGSYERTEKIKDTYQRQIFDVCRGKLISQIPIAREHLKKKRLAIQNPNLDSNIYSSIQLAPLTEEEAQKAFTELGRKCHQSPISIDI